MSGLKKISAAVREQLHLFFYPQRPAYDSRSAHSLQSQTLVATPL